MGFDEVPLINHTVREELANHAAGSRYFVRRDTACLGCCPVARVTLGSWDGPEVLRWEKSCVDRLAAWAFPTCLGNPSTVSGSVPGKIDMGKTISNTRVFKKDGGVKYVGVDNYFTQGLYSMVTNVALGFCSGMRFKSVGPNVDQFVTDGEGNEMLGIHNVHSLHASRFGCCPGKEGKSWCSFLCPSFHCCLKGAQRTTEVKGPRGEGKVVGQMVSGNEGSKCPCLCIPSYGGVLAPTEPFRNSDELVAWLMLWDLSLNYGSEDNLHLKNWVNEQPLQNVEEMR